MPCIYLSGIVRFNVATKNWSRESPSPFISDDVRQAMADAAIKAAKSINYRGAGTIEFIVDDQQNFYFMEMNTRIQVEHPVTECITGTDLIKEQIKIAATDQCKMDQATIYQTGHAIEFRINAEDPDRDFLPMPGTLELFLPPVDQGFEWIATATQGTKFHQTMIPLLAKLIVWAPTRQECIDRAKRALNEFIVDGVKPPFLFI